MSAPATREEFLDLVRKSGVIDDERVAEYGRSLKDSAVAVNQPQAVAQRMIRDGLLTSWQAKQILQGKWRKFVISGKYKLLDLLGAGGMGQVWLCQHIYMNRLVAVKVLPRDKLKDPSTLERFYREARAAGALDHPNIVRAFDIDHEPGDQGSLHYLVMEYVDGASLQEMVSRRGPMTPVRAAHYVKQAADGLQHAHEAGLVHRDVKPGNLLLDRSGTVKVLDLGLARFFEPGKDNVTERYDEKNAILGTADYLSPEQARGDAVDIRADVYSLGATFYFLLTGKAPFEEGTITQKLLWSQTKAPKPIRELRPEVPAKMLAVIDRMMAKDANDRYPTPQAVADALAPWTATPIPPPTADEMPRRSPAASSPVSQSFSSFVPSTPAPRTVPADLVRAAPASGPKLRPPAPKTPAPSAGPRSRSTMAATRPAAGKPRRPSAGAEAAGWTLGAVFAVVGGGAMLIILGLVIAWLIVGGKGRTPHQPAPPPPGPALAGTQPPPVLPVPTGGTAEVIRPDQAPQHLDQRRTVEMIVLSVGKATTAERYFLNSKANRTAADNFTVTFTKGVLDQLGAKNVHDLEARFKDKTVRVTGTITKYNDKPQIEVGSADQIQLVTR